MSPSAVIVELEHIERQCRAIRAELGRDGNRQQCRAFVETDAGRLLKHAAKLYADTCRPIQENSLT